LIRSFETIISYLGCAPQSWRPPFSIGTAIIIALFFFLAEPECAVANDQAEPRAGRSPAAVMVYVHPTVKDRRFLEPLVCALEKVLAAPVVLQDLALPLGSELYANWSQIDSSKAVDYFAQSVPGPENEITFRTLIIPNDLKTGKYNYVFASARFDYRFSSQVISTARFLPWPWMTGDEGVQLLMRRLYKSILRSVVQSAGHMDMIGCVMAFPHSLAEHDAKPAHLCPDDHAQLVQEGVLRAHEKENCQDAIASYEPLQWPNIRRRKT
jgi:predicted Zn-dependent protease